MVARLTELLEALRAERALPLGRRETRADDQQLESAIDKVTQARQRVEEGNGPRAEALMAEVARLVGDGWSYTSPLANEVLACAQRLRRP